MAELSFKSRVARQHLKGRGIEFGALHKPLDVDATSTRMHYADRLERDAALTLFPELEEFAADFVTPDVILDFNGGDYEQLREYAFDFFVANHFIEHLVNPIQFLVGLNQVMKSEALLFLTVPDKDFTFDSARDLTTNEHLWREYERGERHLSNAHIREFLKNKAPVTVVHPAIQSYFRQHGLPLSYYKGNRLPLNPVKRRRLYEFHRERSIHVHVWNRRTFDEFLHWINGELDLGFEIRYLEDDDADREEMIYLLRKVTR